MTPSEKLQRLNELAQRDSRHPQLRELAHALMYAAELSGDRSRFLSLALTVARDWIRYVTDTKRTGGEDVAGMTRPPEPPLAVLWRGADDCDAKARLFVALCLAEGFQARIEGEEVGDHLAHVWGLVRVADHWTPAETTLARARLGDAPRSVPKETGGQWLYS